MAQLFIKIILTDKNILVDGTEENKTLGKLLSEILLSETTGDPIKLHDWGTQLRQENILEVDDSDYKTIYELLKTTPRVVVTSRAQIMKKMDEAKEKTRQQKGK